MIMTFAEFLEGAEVGPPFELDEEARKALRLNQQRRNEEWSLLGFQVVGAEVLASEKRFFKNLDGVSGE